MKNTVVHKADTRGHANHGWLKAYHTFSFANYHNPERIHFGALRVLNDDTIEGGKGFGMHPHDNMEIITIPLEGDLEHKDSMGNVGVIRQGDIQVMSAGTGVFHSEYNKNQDKEVKLLQIWVFSNKRNVAPRYDQITLNPEDKKNKFQQIVSPNQDDKGMWIHQNAWFNLGKFDQEMTAEYNLNDNQNGVYAFIIKGKANIEEQNLDTRDGMGIWNVNSLKITILEPETEILLMEVPMKI
ncbi:MAG: pirin family protein [Flavobacteriaceae bacterium]